MISVRSNTSDRSSSTGDSLVLSIDDLERAREDIINRQTQDSTRATYHSVWRNFNKFFIHLDRKPDRWEERISLYATYLVKNQERPPGTVKSYCSAIRYILKGKGIMIRENSYILSSLIRVCKIRNNRITHTRLLIQKRLLRLILEQVESSLLVKNQPYLAMVVVVGSMPAWVSLTFFFFQHSLAKSAIYIYNAQGRQTNHL